MQVHEGEMLVLALAWQTYDLTSSITEPNEFIFVERWETREALTAHFETPHLKHWRTLCGDFLAKRSLEIIKPEQVET